MARRAGEKDDAEEEQQYADDRRPPDGDVWLDELLDNGDDPKQEAEKGGADAEARDDPQRQDRVVEVREPQLDELLQRVARGAVLPLMVLDLDVADVTRHAGEERIHLGVVVLVLDDLLFELPRDDPEVARADVVGPAEQLVRGDPVEPAREVLHGPVGGLSVDPVDEVIPLAHLVEQDGNLGGLGLEVVVHAQDEVALRVPHGAHEPVVLAKVPHEAQPVDVGVLLGKLPDHAERPVGGAVVNEHELALVVGKSVKLRHDLLDHAANR